MYQNTEDLEAHHLLLHTLRGMSPRMSLMLTLSLLSFGKCSIFFKRALWFLVSQNTLRDVAKPCWLPPQDYGMCLWSYWEIQVFCRTCKWSFPQPIVFRFVIKFQETRTHHFLYHLCPLRCSAYCFSGEVWCDGNRWGIVSFDPNCAVRSFFMSAHWLHVILNVWRVRFDVGNFNFADFHLQWLLGHVFQW